MISANYVSLFHYVSGVLPQAHCFCPLQVHIPNTQLPNNDIRRGRFFLKSTTMFRSYLEVQINSLPQCVLPRGIHVRTVTDLASRRKEEYPHFELQLSKLSFGFSCKLKNVLSVYVSIFTQVVFILWIIYQIIFISNTYITFTIHKNRKLQL